MAGNELELSVIIPTYNRGVVLEKCLEALSCQTLSKDVFEVIVSDDGSDGAVRDRIEPFLRYYQ
jgi:glycosyltransferase involved in cell wall biosynthesis